MKWKQENSDTIVTYSYSFSMGKELYYTRSIWYKNNTLPDVKLMKLSENLEMKNKTKLKEKVVGRTFILRVIWESCENYYYTNHSNNK